jgi:hypothetical protein
LLAVAAVAEQLTQRLHSLARRADFPAAAVAAAALLSTPAQQAQAAQEAVALSS